jgi:hypothetical protein
MVVDSSVIFWLEMEAGAQQMFCVTLADANRLRTLDSFLSDDYSVHRA